MEAVAITLAALACPVGMLTMGWFMTKGMRKKDQSEPLDVEDLRAEHRRLGAEIERLEAPDPEEHAVVRARRAGGRD